MSNRNKVMASAAFYILVGALMFYAASRTLHFVQNVMAESIWGYLFLFATSGGAVIWLYVYLALVQGAKQRAIAFALGLIDLCGEMALVYADTIYVGSKAGLVTMGADELRTFVIVSVAIVGVNIFAGYLFKLFDLKAEQDQQAQDLVDHVTDATMKALQKPEAKAQMVNELMPVLSESIKARVSAEIYDRASSSSGLSARAVGWPLGSELEEKEVSVPLALARGDMKAGGLWTQSITSKDGTKRRAFCLQCLSEGKSWIGGELCDHMQNVEPVAPKSELDEPQSLSTSGARDAGN